MVAVCHTCASALAVQPDLPPTKPASPASPASPALLVQAHYRDHGKLQFARSLLVLHNTAHQGRAPLDDLQWLEVPERYESLFRWLGGAVGRGQGRRFNDAEAEEEPVWLALPGQTGVWCPV